MRKVKSKVGDAWHKVSINPKAMVKVERGTAELNETFNNPGLVLMNLCSAACATWNSYDALSVVRSKNDLILTRSEKYALRDVGSKLLDVYMTLDGLRARRMRAVGLMKEGGAK